MDRKEVKFKLTRKVVFEYKEDKNRTEEFLSAVKKKFYIKILTKE